MAVTKTHNIVKQYNGNGVTHQVTISNSGSEGTSVDIDITTGQTNYPVVFTLDYDACKSFWLMSTQNVTLKTNSSGSPTNTINLVANTPYIWDFTSYDTFLITADITSLFITNSSGATANLTIESVVDASS